MRYVKEIATAAVAVMLVLAAGAPAQAAVPAAAVDNSHYRGLWFNDNHESTRRCIVWRESRGEYGAVSRTGKYRGAYQFSPELTVGVTWMMQPEVRKERGKDGLLLMRKLRSTPMNRWEPYWQDRAFWTVWRHGKGKQHWNSTRHRC